MKNFSRSILFLICLTVLFASFVGAQEKQSEDLFVITVNGKQGYINKKGEVVIKPQFHFASEFSEDLAIVVEQENYKAGFIDKTGKVVIKPQFDDALNFSEGFAAVGFGEYGMHDGGEHKTGFIDKTGKIVIEPKFRDAWSFSEGLAVVRDKGKSGFIDRTGKVVIPLIYEAAFAFSEGLAVIKSNGKFGFIDKTGKIVVEPQYSAAKSFSEGLACVKIGEPEVDENGYEKLSEGITFPTLLSGKVNSSGKTVISDGITYNFINKKGKIVLGNYYFADSFSDGLAHATKNGNHGFINKTGTFVIKSDLEIVSGYSEGLIQVKFFNYDSNDDFSYESGFIDKNEKTIFKTAFEHLYDFQNGLAQFCEEYSSEAKCGYIDKTGKVIWQPTN